MGGKPLRTEGAGARVPYSRILTHDAKYESAISNPHRQSMPVV